MSTNSSTDSWFSEWFDSPYYHVLYSNRDESEANVFIDRLLRFIRLPEGSDVLDLACGKGRHSITFANHGMKVLGLDLSPSSIAEAKKHESSNLKFVVGDMRNLTFERQFDLVANLFTSFGYFDDLSDNLRVIEGIARALKPNGYLVIDFFNGNKVVANLIEAETIQRNGISFHIHRYIRDGRVIKDIRFRDGKDYEFQERVQLIFPKDFESMMDQFGFKIIHTFGSYSLDSFDERHSDRFIFIAQIE